MSTTLIDAIEDPNLFGHSFQGDTWDTWKAVLSAAFALPMTDAQVERFKRLAGGREPPSKRVRELVIVGGRRPGKTKIAAAVGDYIATIGATLDGTRDRLSPGERGIVSLQAVDRRQARVASDYGLAMLEESPILKPMIVKASSESIDLDNGCRIEVNANSFRSIRGRTLLAAIFDEAAFWRSDTSANPDREVYRAAVPALATTGGMLIIISSPYAKRGLLWEKYRKHFGKDGDDVLVIQGTTRDFNPTIPQSVVDQAVEDDPEGAKSEWLGQFRDDIEAFIQRESVEACIRPSPLSLAYDRSLVYSAFVDPAGGGNDEFCLSISHVEGNKTIVDLICARKGKPAAIVSEFAQIIRSYGLRTIHGDRYAGSWPRDEFQNYGIRYLTSSKSKSELYIDLLPLIHSEQIELPPDNKAITQLIGLERRTSRAGKDSIDHAPGMHDDRANVIAGAAHVATTGRKCISTTTAAIGAY